MNPPKVIEQYINAASYDVRRKKLIADLSIESLSKNDILKKNC